MPNFSEWLIVGSVTFFVGATASAIIQGNSAGALLGSTTGAVLGAAISSKRQDEKQRDTEIELKRLKEQSVKHEEWKKLNAELAILKPQVAELRKQQAELATVEGQFV